MNMFRLQLIYPLEEYNSVSADSMVWWMDEGLVVRT